MRIYINGIEEGSNSGVSRGSTYSTECHLAQQYNNKYNYLGLIDQVVVYDYERTASQIAWEYNKGKPIGYWKFDECAGETIYDSSGKGNNGQLYLGTSGTTATGTCASSSDSFWYNGRDGKRNAAGDFDSFDNAVIITDNSLFDFTSSDDFTFSMWFKTNHGSTETLIEKRETSGSNRGYTLWIAAGGGGGDFGFQLNDNSTNSFSNYGAGYDDDEWHHVILTVAFSSNTANVYVDGINVGNNIDISSVTGDITNNEDLLIGEHISNFEWNGLIDEVKIFNYALTAEQVKTEYGGGAVRFGN